MFLNSAVRLTLNIGLGIFPSNLNCQLSKFIWNVNQNCVGYRNKHFSTCVVINEIKIKQDKDYCCLINKRFAHSDIKNLCFIDFNENFSEEEKELIAKNMIVDESFLSVEEENSLLNEIEPYMKRLRYEFSHWDDAIHGYRETERLKWNEENTKIIDRVRNFAFLPGSPHLAHVHILDLAEDGYIKPHIDAVRFCGNTIAGLSLLTDSVMRLVHDKDKTKVADVLLNRLSLYVMRDTVRYDYTHEILQKSESKFKQQAVEKKRRISVICRNEPSQREPDDPNSKSYTR